jgi:hypothetical protein
VKQQHEALGTCKNHVLEQSFDMYLVEKALDLSTPIVKGVE